MVMRCGGTGVWNHHLQPFTLLYYSFSLFTFPFPSPTFIVVKKSRPRIDRNRPTPSIFTLTTHSLTHSYSNTLWLRRSSNVYLFFCSFVFTSTHSHFYPLGSCFQLKCDSNVSVCTIVSIKHPHRHKFHHDKNNNNNSYSPYTWRQ